MKTNLLLSKGKCEGEGKIWSLGLTHATICKIDTNKNLLYNTGNSIQYTVIIYVEKNQREWIYVLITESLHCTSKTITTL